MKRTKWKEKKNKKRKEKKRKKRKKRKERKEKKRKKRKEKKRKKRKEKKRKEKEKKRKRVGKEKKRKKRKKRKRVGKEKKRRGLTCALNAELKSTLASVGKAKHLLKTPFYTTQCLFSSPFQSPTCLKALRVLLKDWGIRAKGESERESKRERGRKREKGRDKKEIARGRVWKGGNWTGEREKKVGWQRRNGKTHTPTDPHIQSTLTLSFISPLIWHFPCWQIPNAIEVSTNKGNHFFASFAARDVAYRLGQKERKGRESQRSKERWVVIDG